MHRQALNRFCLYLPLAMSLAALLLVLSVRAFGDGAPERDEGAGAHVLQLLLAGQLPLIALFLASAEWARRPVVLRRLLLQVGSIGLAVASLAGSGL